MKYVSDKSDGGKWITSLFLSRFAGCYIVTALVVLQGVASAYELYTSRHNAWIHYTSRVADKTDEYGYGTTPLLWSVRGNSPNGIPDYVDELGWAFDSVWSALYESGDFISPLPTRSDLEATYVITVQSLDKGILGRTVPADKKGFMQPGYKSYMKIANDFDGTPLKNQVVRAMRVVVAHEIFHGSQYAGVSYAEKAEFDDFPLGWIEGTATYMPHRVFPDTDNIDLLKSLHSRYFDDPTVPIFADIHDGKTEYRGFLGAYFIAEGVNHEYGIELIADIFRLNAEERRSLPALGDEAAKKHNTDWATILNDFYTESYFTGDRSDTRLFVPEAGRLEKWDCQIEPLHTPNAVELELQPWGMNRYGFTFSTDAPQEVPFSILSVDPALEDVGTRRVSFIVDFTDDAKRDTILSRFSERGGYLSIPAGSGNLVAVVTNAADTARTLCLEMGKEPTGIRYASEYSSEIRMYQPENAFNRGRFSPLGRQLSFDGISRANGILLVRENRRVRTMLQLSVTPGNTDAEK